MDFKIVKKFNGNFHSCLSKLSNDKSGKPYYINIDDHEYSFPERLLDIIGEVTVKTDIACSLEDLYCIPETGFIDFGRFMVNLDTNIEYKAIEFAELFFAKLTDNSI